WAGLAGPRGGGARRGRSGGYSMTRKTVPFLGGGSRKAWSVVSALPPFSAGIVRVSHSFGHRRAAWTALGNMRRRPIPAEHGPASGVMPGHDPANRLGHQCLRRMRLSVHVAERGDRPNRIAGHICRSTIIRLISAMALAGLRCLGQALAQSMMVWQR